MKNITFALCLIMTVALVVVGCGKEKRCALSGVVTSDGEPVPTGVVNFIPENADPTQGVAGSSCQIENGAYAMDPKGPLLLPGKYKVQVISTVYKHKKTGEIVDPYDVKDGKYQPTDVEVVDLVPPKFGVETDQYVEVGKDAKMTYDINMTSK